MKSDLRAATALALASAAITILRMLLGDTRSITEVLWAEDGYFPLCARNDGAINCLFQSYAGYFLLVPRLGAGLVQLFAYEEWPIISTAMAAAVAAFSSLVVYLAVRNTKVSARSSVLAALVLPFLPLFGIEAIGVLASAYIPLLVAAAVAVVVVSPGRRSGVSVFGLLLISGLTMPSTAVFLGAILIRLLVGNLARLWSSLWATALGLGFAVQSVFAFASPSDRGLAVSRNSLRAWVDGVTDSALSLVPGLSWKGTEFSEYFPVANPWYGAWMVTVLLAAWGMYSIYSCSKGPRTVQSTRRFQLGLLTITALGLSLFPSLAGEVSFRYFVAPLCIVVIGLIVRFDGQILSASRNQLWAGVLIVAVLWLPAFAASQVRSSPAPSWLEELDRVRALCTERQDGSEEIVFTPVWPGVLEGPKIPAPKVRCNDL